MNQPTTLTIRRDTLEAKIEVTRRSIARHEREGRSADAAYSRGWLDALVYVQRLADL